MSAEWIERAEALLSDPAAPMPEQAQLLRGQRPVILDAQAARALWLCALSAGLWWIALREPTEAEALLSPIGLLLRLLALGTSVRALSVLRSLLARLPVWARASKTALVLLDEGMLLRRPEGDIAIERDHIVRVLEAGDWSDRPSGRRFSEVFVVIRPAAGRDHLILPPVLDETPGRLAERLMAWRGVVPVAEGFEHPAPEGLPSKIYDEAAAGRPGPGVSVVPHGHAWIRRGPFAALLLALLVLETILRMPAEVPINPALPAIIALCVAVPLGWVLMARRHVEARKGLALLLTPAELLLRTRAGIIRTRWSELRSVRIESSPGWSLLDGIKPTRQLVLERRDEAPIRYDEPYLGLPAELTQAMLEAYRKGQSPG